MPASRAGQSVAALGEFGLIARLIAREPSLPGTILASGDDCALLTADGRGILATIDSFVEGVHFQRSWLTPSQLGARCAMASVSDIAAMGGSPRWLLVAMAIPPAGPASEVVQMQRAIERVARGFGADVVGGNLTQSKALSLTIAVLGLAGRRTVTRSGARPGDRLFVTGRVGDSALAVRALLKGRKPDREFLRRYVGPQARVAAGRALAERGIASAMIDVSDGLVQDAGHLAESSQVRISIESSKVPVSRAYRRCCGEDRDTALRGGEDYELLFSVPRARLARLERYRGDLGCEITEVGCCEAGEGVFVDGKPIRGAGGFDHFRKPGRR